MPDHLQENKFSSKTSVFRNTVVKEKLVLVLYCKSTMPLMGVEEFKDVSGDAFSSQRCGRRKLAAALHRCQPTRADTAL